MKERISKDLIKRGLKQNVIRIDKEEDLLAAHIGDYWFYIGSNPFEEKSDYTEDELITMVWKTVNDTPINDENEDNATECLYYKALLEENCPEKIHLERPYPTKAEKELYLYTGYYMYSGHGQPDTQMYVKTDDLPDRYGLRKECPKSMTLEGTPDLDSAIVFTTNDFIVTTGNMPLDAEILRLIGARADELGFSYRNEDNILLHKIQNVLTGNEPFEFSEEELKHMMQLITNKT